MTLISGLVCRIQVGCHDGASGEFRNTGSAAASSAWACLLLFVLVFAGVLIGAVRPASATFSSAPAFQLSPNRWLFPPRPSARFWQCLAKQGLVPTRAARSWRAGEKSTHSSSSFQLPPRGATSGFRRCFHSAAAAWLLARSSFRLKARLLRRFHRAGQQLTPRGAASGAHRTAQRRAAPPFPKSI